MGVTSTARTTVAIPLHASAPWLAVVEGNIRRLASYARIVVSDASGADDALEHLRQQCADVPGIVWRTTPAPPGWIGHCNTLLSEARSEFFMWLPHDDDVSADWIAEAERALDADPSAVLAVGVVEAYTADGRFATFEIDPRTLDADLECRLAGVADHWVNGDLSSLGAAFRGVFRREVAPPLPQLDDLGSWGDLLWAGEFLKRGRFAAIESRYLKRYHSGNTHPSWVKLREDPRLRSQVIPELLAAVSPEVALRAACHVWEKERLERSAEVALLKSHLVASEQLLRDTAAAFRSSTSWRVTRPARAIGRLLKRLAVATRRRRPDLGDLHDE